MVLFPDLRGGRSREKHLQTFVWLSVNSVQLLSGRSVWEWAGGLENSASRSAFCVLSAGTRCKNGPIASTDARQVPDRVLCEPRGCCLSRDRCPGASGASRLNARKGRKVSSGPIDVTSPRTADLGFVTSRCKWPATVVVAVSPPTFSFLREKC